jgi:6-phosphogluconolactonase/glucosamine-6-phosphate isomerase/deaminase
MELGVPERITRTIDVIHDTHEELLSLKNKAKQAACKHTTFTYKHSDYDEECRYCNLDACNLRECLNCGKEL